MPDITLIKGTFKSTYGDVVCSYHIYEPKKPRAVIQLSHGMCEYTARYEPHAEYFAEQGFVFCGNDHIGHGETAKNADELGFTGNADCLINDLAAMTDIVKAKYPELPVFLLGHSMGSFIARLYITKYSDKINGCIISGTAGPESPTGIGKMLAKIGMKTHGDHYRDNFLKSISTGSYSKSFGKDAHPSSWVTSNAEELQKYAADPFCNYDFTVNGYYNMFDLLGRVSKSGWAKNVPNELPILMISGDRDPVGNFGKGVRKVYGRLKKSGQTDLSMVLFEGSRHEPFNETDEIREKAYNTVLTWLNGHIEN